MTDASVPAVEILYANVDYGDVRAVDHVNLRIPTGDVHVLLGHSGSGKTTLLRAIAGFEPLTNGSITIHGRTVDDGTRAGWISPNERRIGFVFQDYALFTHLDAARNIGFGVSGSKAAKREAATSWLGRVQLPEHGARRPGELSGGEQQRIALARALAQEPTLVLLDEPFSNLDPHLRRQVRDQTVRLLRENDATAIFVTHDVEEAFGLADQISVMDCGQIVQTGPPREIYDRPATQHVAQLCGQATFVNIDGLDKAGRARCPLGAIEVHDVATEDDILVIRPEQVRLSQGGEGAVISRRFLGPVEEIEVRVRSGVVVLARTAAGAFDADSGVKVEVSGPVASVPGPA